MSFTSDIRNQIMRSPQILGLWVLRVYGGRIPSWGIEKGITLIEGLNVIMTKEGESVKIE